MQLTPDDSIVLEFGVLRLNATIVNTWIVMALLVGVSWLATRNLRPDAPPSRWRNALEVLVQLIEEQIRAVAQRAVHRVMIFAGTLFLFIATANFPQNIPGPLLDRMEVVEFAGYTEREKAEIAKTYNVPEWTTDLDAALSRLAAERPDLADVEVNPLLVLRDGAVALDARVIMTGSPATGPGGPGPTSEAEEASSETA